MAHFALTHTTSTSSASYAAPTNKDSFVRIENLDSTNDVWVLLGSGAGPAAVEGADCVRVRANQSMLFRTQSSYIIIGAAGTPKVLFQSSMGLE